MIRVQRVKAAEVVRRSFFYRPYLEEALDRSRGECTAKGLLSQAETETVQFWEIMDGPKLIGLLTTSITDYERGAVVRVLTLAGERMAEWQAEMDQALISFGWDHKCRWIEFAGRKGFGPALEKLDYEPVYTVFSKELPNE